MAPVSPDDRFRSAAEAEDGLPVSAGGRAAHERNHVTASRGVFLDLSAVPESLRPGVVSEIQELIRRAQSGNLVGASQSG